MGNYFNRVTGGDHQQKTNEEKIEEKERLRELIRTKLHSFTKNKQLFGVENEQDLKSIKKSIGDIIKNSGTFLALNDQVALTEEMLLDITSLGKISHLMKDEDVTEIMVNAIDDVWVERRSVGVEKCTDIHFKDDEEVMQLARKIAGHVNRSIDLLHPILDARLPDRSRVNIVIPPIAMDGVAITIRKFFTEKLTIKDLMKFKTMTPEVARFLEKAVRSRSNMLVSGGTNSGKTTTLNVLSNFIPSDERILTIEDSAELQLNNEHVVRMETRNANAEGKGGISIRDLVKTSLRMNPSRIVVGEVRDLTAYDLMQSMNSGHDGALATIHANDPDGAVTRLDNLISEAGLNLPNDAIRKLIGNSVDLIVQINKMSDNVRRITHVSEVVVNDDGEVRSQPIFEWRITGNDGNKLLGEYIRTDYQPSQRFINKFIQHNEDISEFLRGEGE